MKFIKNDSGDADPAVIIGTVLAIIFIGIILFLGWDAISQAVSKFHSATCVNDSRVSSWNNC